MGLTDSKRIDTLFVIFYFVAAQNMVSAHILSFIKRFIGKFICIVEITLMHRRKPDTDGHVGRRLGVKTMWNAQIKYSLADPFRRFAGQLQIAVAQ